MIDKKFLESLGVTDEETVNKIVAEYGADIKVEKDAVSAAQAQLSEANTQIESFKGMDVEAIQKSADDWKTKYEKSESDRAEFEHKTKLTNYVKGLNLKDDVYENYVTGTLIEKGLKFDGDKLIGGEDVVNTFKESHPDAFKAEELPPKFSYSVNGGNNTSVGGVEAAFLAKNPNLKID
ncbi:MAG: phage scaffolding protein [Oscillospiraceae bacterium]|nr:phage scaffolding protein [Oscillospiraceae bacterium]